MNEAQAILRSNDLPIKQALSTLLEQVKLLIRMAATLGKKECFFDIPPIVLDCPITYDQEKMRRSLAKLLRDMNYIVFESKFALRILFEPNKTELVNGHK